MRAISAQPSGLSKVEHLGLAPPVPSINLADRANLVHRAKLAPARGIESASPKRASIDAIRITLLA